MAGNGAVEDTTAIAIITGAGNRAGGNGTNWYRVGARELAGSHGLLCPTRTESLIFRREGVMPKTSQPESDTRSAPSPEKAEEIRRRLLINDGIRERISFRAYELYQRRGGEPGHELEDWALAENDILAPLIEQELKPSRKAPTKNVAKREAAEMGEQGTKAAPTKKATSGKTQKTEAAPAKKTKPRS